MSQFPHSWTKQQTVVDGLGAAGAPSYALSPRLTLPPGAVLGFAMFAAPLPLFRRLWAAKSTGDYDGFPYIATGLNCSLWVLYGIVTPGRLAPFATNLVGIAVETGYCLVFYRLAASREGQVRHAVGCAAAAAFVTAFSLVVLLLVPRHARTPLVGAVADVFNVGMFASPLSVMRAAWRSQSTAGLPGLLSLVMLVCAGVWTAYGAYLADASILVPNAMGTAVTLVQCFLYAYLSPSSAAAAAAAPMGFEDTASELLLGDDAERAGEQARLAAEREEAEMGTAVVLDWVA